ncbi:mechanosensitive ion channel family protein [Patescibacteria group bacterium]
MLNITFENIATNIYLQKIIRIIAIIVVGEIVKRIIKISVKKLRLTPQRFGNGALANQSPRVKTISNFIKNTSSIIVNFIVLVMVLDELGVNIAPIITGAGILGLAVGFGARSLVSDLIAGFFIIFESQFNVGDKIEVAGHKGKVVKITLRTITLKDKDKKRYIVPNSAIKTVTKFPKKKQ